MSLEPASKLSVIKLHGQIQQGAQEIQRWGTVPFGPPLATALQQQRSDATYQRPACIMWQAC